MAIGDPRETSPSLETPTPRFGRARRAADGRARGVFRDLPVCGFKRAAAMRG